MQRGTPSGVKGGPCRCGVLIGCLEWQRLYSWRLQGLRGESPKEQGNRIYARSLLSHIVRSGGNSLETWTCWELSIWATLPRLSPKWGCSPCLTSLITSCPYFTSSMNQVSGFSFSPVCLNGVVAIVFLFFLPDDRPRLLLNSLDMLRVFKWMLQTSINVF